MFNSVSRSQHGAPAPSGQMPSARTGMEELAGNDGAEPVLKSRHEQACARAGMRTSWHTHEQAQGRFGKAGARTWQRQLPRTDRRVAATAKNLRRPADGTSPAAP